MATKHDPFDEYFQKRAAWWIAATEAGATRQVTEPNGSMAVELIDLSYMYLHPQPEMPLATLASRQGKRQASTPKGSL